MGHRKHVARLFYFTLTMLLVLSGLVIYGLSNSSISFPFGLKDYLNTQDYFSPFTGLDIVSSSVPAPGISCSLTNNVHLIGTDGSDYDVPTAGPMFTPVANSLVPYSGATLDHVTVYVYLYCNASTLTQYGYYPYLVGGNVGMTFYTHDANGILRISQPIQYVNIPTTPMQINGISVKIASFTEPASAINSVMGANFSPSSYSVQNAVTSGVLQFQQKPNLPPTYTYSITPLLTAYSLSGDAIGGSPSPTATAIAYGQSVDMAFPSQTQSYTVDSSKYAQVQVAVTVNNYNSGNENPPNVVIYKLQTNNVVSFTNGFSFNMPVQPTTVTGTYSHWVANIPINSLASCSTAQCNYEAALESQKLSNGITRQGSAVDFIIQYPYVATPPPINCATTNTCPTQTTTTTTTTSTSTTTTPPPTPICSTTNSCPQQTSTTTNTTNLLTCGTGLTAGWTLVSGTCTPSLAALSSLPTSFASLLTIIDSYEYEIFALLGAFIIISILLEKRKKGSIPRPGEMEMVIPVAN